MLFRIRGNATRVAAMEGRVSWTKRRERMGVSMVGRYKTSNADSDLRDLDCCPWQFHRLVLRSPIARKGDARVLSRREMAKSAQFDRESRRARRDQIIL